MKQSIYITILLAVAGILYFQPTARAQTLGQIGVTMLRAMTTNLNGAGIRVAQPEGVENFNPLAWEVSPAETGHPVSLFTFASDAGSANGYPNAVGTNSVHANYVGDTFYGMSGGVATNVAHVDSFDMNYFCNHYILSNLTVLNDSVVNQSFLLSEFALPNPQLTDARFDDYAARFGTLFVSAAGNGGSVEAPATSYNSIAVAAYNGASSVGPTADNGRCKPDITAPAYVTSFSAPQVAGAAALLMQAALRGDGGADTNAAFDLRTIKALLLNGAVKPAGWTNANASPLDARYGAGVVNVFNSYQQLAGGKQSFSQSNLLELAAPHLPSGDTSTMATLNGWNFDSLSSSVTNDAVVHYLFNVPSGISTVTLVWNRQYGQTNINNLDLFLYDCANSNLVACSTSHVDNVEHLFIPNLAAGRYDLQVWKAGGSNIVSEAEAYALVFAFTSPTLNLAQSGTNMVLSWPAYPAGFVVEASTNLTLPGGWSVTNLPASGFTNGQNILLLNAVNEARFFRLRQP